MKAALRQECQRRALSRASMRQRLVLLAPS
jgi:hypothetical protein